MPGIDGLTRYREMKRFRSGMVTLLVAGHASEQVVGEVLAWPQVHLADDGPKPRIAVRLATR